MNRQCSEDPQLEDGVHTAEEERHRFIGEGRKSGKAWSHRLYRECWGACDGDSPLMALLPSALTQGQSFQATSALKVHFSKSCFRSLSFVASAFSATVFHCSVLTSQMAFSGENNVLLEMGSRSKCCYYIGPVKYSEWLLRWKWKFSFSHIGPRFAPYKKCTNC